MTFIATIDLRFITIELHYGLSAVQALLRKSYNGAIDDPQETLLRRFSFLPRGTHRSGARPQ